METPIYHLEKVIRSREEGAEDFNGPLDLILSLLAKNKMEIQDIQISLILEQYLAWMDKRRSLELEVASEFVTMAAQLMFIKTRMLLSIHDEEAISELVKGKTLLVIAHRLNTIQNADQILVISDGRISQHGTHEELMKQPGIYQDFVHIRMNSAGWSLS